MPQPFKRNFLQHALAVSQWMKSADAKGGMDPRTLAMEISLGGKAVRFVPQFVTENEGGLIGFTPELGFNVSGFVGWYPYFGKTWIEAQDKRAFKRYAQSVGLRVPAWTVCVEEVKGPFLVKHRRSTLGRSMRGPFVAAPPPAPQASVQLDDGEYCEQFIFGKLLKAWYWNGSLCVIEAVPMPTVKGDGRSTARQLISQALPSGEPWSEAHDHLLTLQGCDAAFPLPAGVEVVSDYRYMSALNPAIGTDYNIRREIVGSDLERQLEHAGRLCLACIPADIREHTAFTLDGIVDAAGIVHFLEANCNPLLHPAFYAPMLDSIFSTSSVKH